MKNKMKNILKSLKSTFTLKTEVSASNQEDKARKVLKILYRPAESGEVTLKGLNLYTVEVTDALVTGGKKSGIIGRVEERGNEFRSFRFDRMVSMIEA